MAETDVVFTSGEAKRRRTGSEKPRAICENNLEPWKVQKV